MPRYEEILGYKDGLVNRPKYSAINRITPEGLSKAQNISVDRRGAIGTIGGLETHSEVPTHPALLSPGSGLFTYGSDHWRGTETIVDLLADNNCTADEQTEVNVTTGWTQQGGTWTSETPAGEGIASDGTSFILKCTAAAGTGGWNAVQTVNGLAIGQRYKAHARGYNLDSSIADFQMHISEPATIAGSTVTGSWVTLSFEFVATATSLVFTCHGANSVINQICYFDQVYLTQVIRRDLNSNWLALADAANAQVDLYDTLSDDFDTARLDFGTVASYTGGAGDFDFPTTNTITDAITQFFSNNIIPGKVYKISGCSTTTANNILFVADHVTEATITARGTPFVVTAAEAGTVTLTEYNPTDFHFIDDSLSVSPAGGGSVLRPKQYRFVDRFHFVDTGPTEREFANWFLNDVGLAPPTDVEASASNGDQSVANLSAGAGFQIGITTTADDGEWSAGTYIVANSFIYDDGQESELFVPSTDEEFGTAVVDNDSLTLTVLAKNNYDERISGGRIYARLDESDDPWVLLADISMADGARATLSGQYNSWNESAGTSGTVAFTGNFKSISQNTDSYESLAGIDPSIRVEKFTSDNAFWDTSVIAHNRTFIASVRYTDAGGKLSHFRDRILYSKPNNYDVFPIDNLIDVTGSDAEDYVKLGIYGSDLLAFKEQTLYIIDISDPDPTGWLMKEDANRGKYPFRGITNPAAYFETPNGPVWCNKKGIWLYDGERIIDLLGDRVEKSKFPKGGDGFYKLDGTNDHITREARAVAAYPFTMACMFKTTGTSETLVSFEDKSEENVYYRIGVDASGKAIIEARNTTLQTGTSTAAFNDGEWHSAVGIFTDATTRELLIDNTSVITDADSVTYNTNVDRMSVGRLGKATPSEFCSGDVTNVMVDNAAFSSAQRTEYENGIVPTGTQNGFPARTATDATWTDSEASFDLTVDGATFVYPDTWESFWTDYSIVGYYSKTNQVIIMRDCTGKFSSGQDFGDVWIVDLDTLAHTTGRRVFTAGTAFTNFATDWNQDLIIGEQSSTNIITKKWTDEPQSQAVGLIDIRTADLIGSLEATRDSITGFVIPYKSSAAQTTPVSYALDGADLPTAWTRFTGNLSATSEWTRLVIDSGTPIDAANIRLKIDNPSSAGTIEIGPISVRRTEYTDKLE